MSPSQLISYLENQNRQHAGLATPLRDEPMDAGPADVEPEMPKTADGLEDSLVQLGNQLKQSSEGLPAVDLVKMVLDITSHRLAELLEARNEVAHPKPPAPAAEDEEIQVLAIQPAQQRTDLSAYPGLSHLPSLPHPAAVKAGPRYAWPLVPEAEEELLHEMVDRVKHLITGSVALLEDFNRTVTQQGFQAEDLEDSLLFVKILDPSFLVLAHNGSNCLELLHLMEHSSPGQIADLTTRDGWRRLAGRRPILMAKLLPLINIDTLYAKTGDVIKADFSCRYSLADIAGFKALRRCLYLPRVLKLIQLFRPRAGSQELLTIHQDRCPKYTTGLAPYPVRLQRRETRSIEKIQRSRQVLSDFYNNAGTPEPEAEAATQRKVKQHERKISTDSSSGLKDADGMTRKKKAKKPKRSKAERLERKKKARD